MLRRKRQALRNLLIAVSVAICIVALGAYLYWSRPAEFDPILQKAFSNASRVDSYEEAVQTQALLSGSTLRVDGTYLLDAPDGRYASFSTTTLVSTGKAKPVVFTLDNITIGADLYTKVQAEGKVTLAVPSSSTWRHFQADAIPAAYAGIAIAGPLLDNLKLLGGGGKYLEIIGKPVEESKDGVSLAHYTFKLSSAAQPTLPGTLGALIQRIGESGVIDVWIDASSSEIRYMRFQNASYVSTTTIADINEPLMIEAPTVSQ